MATAAKFVQPIPIFLAYLVPLDVDVVPVKFHQFLFVPTMFHEVWIDERNQKSFKIPLLFHWQLRQRLSYWFWFFWGYLVPLDVDVTGYITAKIYEVWSEFNILCTLVTMATAAILNLFNPPKAATHYGGYSYKVSWSLLKRIQNTQPPIHVKTSNTFWLPWFISSTTLPQPRVYFSDSIDFSEIGDYLVMVRGR